MALADLAQVFIQAKDESSPAFDSFVRNNERGIDSVQRFAERALAAYAAIETSEWAGKIVTDTIAVRASLNDMAETTGLTVEKLSQIRQVAIVSGRPFEDLAATIVKFDRALAAAATNQASPQAAAFRQLGIEVSEASLKTKSADEYFQQTVMTLDQYAAGVGKSTNATTLLGKTGADTLPVFKNYAEAAKLAANVTAAQAAEADNAAKAWRQLNLMTAETKEEIGGEMITSITALVDALIGMKEASAEAGGGLKGLVEDGSIRRWAEDTVIFIAAAIDRVKIFGQEISIAWSTVESVALKAAILANAARGVWDQDIVGDPDAAKAALGTMKSLVDMRNQVIADGNEKWRHLMEDQANSTEDATRRILAQLEAQRLAAKYAGAQYQDSWDRRNREGANGPAVKPQLPVSGQLDEARLQKQIAYLQKSEQLQQNSNDNRVKLAQDLVTRQMAVEEFWHKEGLESESEYLVNIEALQAQHAQLAADKAGQDVQLLRDLRSQIAALPAVTLNDQITQKTALAAIDEKILNATTAQTIAQRDLGDVATKSDQAWLDALLKIEDQLVQISRDGQDYIKNLTNQNAAMSASNDLIGASDVAQAKANAEFQLTTQLKQKILTLNREISDLEAKDADPSVIAAKRAEIQKLSDATADAIEERKKLIEEQFSRESLARVSDGISQALLEGGSDAGKKIVQVIEDEFKRNIIKMYLSPIIQGGLSDLGALLGLGGGAGSGSGASGIVGAVGGLGNLLGLGGSSAGGIGSLLGLGSNGGWGATAAGQVEAIEAGYGANLGTTAYAGTGAATSGIGSFLAEAGPYAAAAAAIYAIAQAFTSHGGPKIGGSSEAKYDPAGATVASQQFRIYTPNQQDAAYQDLNQGFESNYHSLVGLLGGNAQALEVILGGDHDPHGTAGSRGTGRVIDAAGQEIFHVQDRGMSDDPTQYSADMKQLTDQMLVAALKDSGLPPAVAKILNSLDVQNASDSAIQDALKAAAAMEDAIKGVQDFGNVIDATIKQIMGDPIDAIKAQLGSLDKAVSDAQDGVDAVINSQDPAKILSAEQTLTAAIVNRYNVEMQALASLTSAMRQSQSEEYDFVQSVSSKINSLGGSIDLGDLGEKRVQQLQPDLSSTDPATRLQAAKDSIAAIENEQQYLADSINAGGAAQQAILKAQQAANTTQADAIKKQIDGLNQQLELTNEWSSVLSQVKSQLDAMTYTDVNPLSPFGRYDLADQNSQQLLTQFRSATDDKTKTALANQLMPALQNQLQLLGENYQRPSAEYQRGYDEIIGALNEVQGAAEDKTDQALDLQKTIAALTDKQNALIDKNSDIDTQIAASAEATTASVNDLNDQIRARLEALMEIGEKAYEEQQSSLKDQIDAITGGVDVSVYQLQAQKDAVTLLKGLRQDMANLANTVAANGAPVVTVTVTPAPVVVTPGYGKPGLNTNPPDGTNEFYTIDQVNQAVVDSLENSTIIYDVMSRQAPAFARLLERT